MGRRLSVLLLIIVMLMYSGVVIAQDWSKTKVTVHADVNQKVKLYAWYPQNNLFLELHEGTTNEEGMYVANFNLGGIEKVTFQVRVLSGKSIIVDEMFENQSPENNLILNCLSGDCLLSVDTSSESFELVENEDSEARVENEVQVDSGEEKTETTSEGDVPDSGESVGGQVQEEIGLEDVNPAVFTGLVIFDDDGSLKGWIIILGGIIIVIIIILVPIAIYKKRGSGNVHAIDKELKIVEALVKKREAEIKVLKSQEESRKKLDAEKEKLAKEEQEIRMLTGGDGLDKKLIEAKKKLDAEEKEIISLKRESEQME